MASQHEDQDKGEIDQRQDRQGNNKQNRVHEAEVVHEVETGKWK